MASNINTAQIDINFPIAGQDNDTQTFRNNFSSIRSNFTTAAAEITAIQTTLTQTPTYVGTPVSTSSSGTTGNIAYGVSYYTPIYVTETNSVGNLIKVSTITNLEPGQAITFDGNLGGIVYVSTYYIKSIFSNGNITVSNVDTETTTLSTASGSIIANASSYYMYICVGTNNWRRTPLKRW